MTKNLPSVRILEGEVLSRQEIIILDDFDKSAADNGRNVMDSFQDFLHRRNPDFFPSSDQIARESGPSKTIDGVAIEIKLLPKPAVS